MAANATLAGAATSTATTVNLSSVVVGGSTTNLAAFVHASKGGGVGTSSGVEWKPTGTPEGFTSQNDGTFFSGDCRSLTAYKHTPSTGTDTVRHTASAAPDEHIIVAWTVTGGTSTARTVPTATTGTSTTPSITNANVQADDAVFYGYSGVENDLTGNTPTVTHGGGQSQGSDTGMPYIGCGASYEVATGTSETGTATWSESCQWREISMAIASGGGGGGATSVGWYSNKGGWW